MYCIKCGEELPDGAKFCYKCGSKLEFNSDNSNEETEESKKEKAKKLFVHDFDKAALSAFMAIPAFGSLSKKFLQSFSGTQQKLMDLYGKVRLSETQMPEVYSLLPPICEKLGIDIPDLYVELDIEPNAYTYPSDNGASITLTSGALNTMSLDEISVVLAHECGHIVCDHVTYHQMARWIIRAVDRIDFTGLAKDSLLAACYYWERCSELSADRCAAYCIGNADKVVDVMLRLAGGTSQFAKSLNREEFLKQADEFYKYRDSSLWKKALSFVDVLDENHPFLAVRAKEIKVWCDTEEYINSFNGEIKRNNMVSQMGRDELSVDDYIKMFNRE